MSIFSHLCLRVSGLLKEEMCGVLKDNVGDGGSGLEKISDFDIGPTGAD